MFTETHIPPVAAPASLVGQPSYVPAGWKLVPLEPTGVMKDIGAFTGLSVGCAEPVYAGRVYRAMVGAAPAPTADQPAEMQDGCGACGDGCQGQACRVSQESPPAQPLLSYASDLQGMALRELGSGAAKPCTATTDQCIQIAQQALVITAKVGALVAAFSSLMTPEEAKAFDRFCECCEDFNAQSHDVPTPMMHRLQLIGLVTHVGWGRYETTDFGDIVRDGVIAALA